MGAAAMTLEEGTDRLAIRELVDAYAHCADRRDCEGQMNKPTVASQNSVR